SILWHVSYCSFSLRRPPLSTLFPYTTLFRSALSLITVVEYLEHTRDFDFVHDIYHTFVAKAARFLQSYRTQGGLLVRPSFDLWEDRKSTRLNSSHVKISYAVFCLKKKTTSKL